MLATICASAKRVPLQDVPPGVLDDIRDSADGDGIDSYVVATDVPSGKELWRIKVFHTRIKFWREEDNQWIFVSDLKFAGDALLVRNEKNRCYSIFLNSKHVKKLQCGTVLPSQEPRH